MLMGLSEEEQQRFFELNREKPWEGLKPNLRAWLKGHWILAVAASERSHEDAKKAMAWRAGLQLGHLEGMAMRLAANISAMNPAFRDKALMLQDKYAQHLDTQEMPRHATVDQAGVDQFSQQAASLESERLQPSTIPPMSRAKHLSSRRRTPGMCTRRRARV